MPVRHDILYESATTVIQVIIMTINSLDMTTAGFTRSLSTASVKISYSVKVTGDALDSAAVQAALTGANAQSQIVDTLSASNQGYIVSAVTDATVTTMSPTASPTAKPVAVPTPAASSTPTFRPSSRPTPSPVPDAAPSSSPISLIPTCFAGSETVTMQNGDVKAISEIQVGDVVLAADASGKTSFSSVVYVPHGPNEYSVNFVHITTSGHHDVKMTPNHIIPAGLCGSNLPLVYASKVSAGDCIMTVTGQEVVDSVAIVPGNGVYTIVTNEEYLVVNGIIASPFGANHMMANLYYNMHRVGFAVAPTLIASVLLQSVNEKFGLIIPLFGPSSL